MYWSGVATATEPPLLPISNPNSNPTPNPKANPKPNPNPNKCPRRVAMFGVQRGEGAVQLLGVVLNSCVMSREVH